MRIRAAPLAGVLACLLLAAVGLLVFGKPGTRGSASTPRPASATTRFGWTRADLRPISQPAPIQGRFVLYAAQQGGLRIVALDAGSGATAWSDAASSSSIAPGEPPTLAIVDGLVIYLRPAGTHVARLVAVDPRSGKVAWETKPGAFTSWPLPCSDDPALVCTTGYLAAEPFGASYLRFGGRSGALLPSAAISPGSTARAVGDGLFDPGTRQPEELLAVKGPSIAWSRTLASLFPLAGASTDWGWDFDRLARPALYVGSVGTRPLVVTRTRIVADLSRAMIAAFRVDDGAVVWRAQGAQYVCGELPCAGSDQGGWADAAAVRQDGTTVGVAMRATGFLTGSPLNPTSPKLSPDAEASLYGFDPATGRPLWRFDAGHSFRLLTQLALPPQTGLDSVVLSGSRDQLVTLDLADGSRHQISPLAPAWCRSVIIYKQNVPYAPLDESSTSAYAGQDSLYPCTSAGRPANTPERIPAFIGELGARVGGVVAWSESSGVLARPS